MPLKDRVLQRGLRAQPTLEHPTPASDDTAWEAQPFIK